MLALIWWMYDGYEIGRSGIRLVAAAAALDTIPLGTQLDAKAQVGALAAIVAVALTVEGARSVRVSVLAVEVESELGRMWPEPHCVDLVLALPVDPGLDQLL